MEIPYPHCAVSACSHEQGGAVCAEGQGGYRGRLERGKNLRWQARGHWNVGVAGLSFRPCGGTEVKDRNGSTFKPGSREKASVRAQGETPREGPTRGHNAALQGRLGPDLPARGTQARGGAQSRTSERQGGIARPGPVPPPAWADFLEKVMGRAPKI